MKSYYHKYFEGYEEDKVLNRNGRGTHIEYTYVGYYFRQGIKNFSRILLRMLYVLMSVAAVGSLIFSSTRLVHCNQTPYMVALQALTLLAFIWFFWVMLSYVFAPKEMTVYKYKSTALQLLKVCKWLTAAFLLDAAAAAADMLLSAGGFQKEQTLCPSAYVLGSMMILGIYIIERALPYERLSNDKEITWYRERMEWRY